MDELCDESHDSSGGEEYDIKITKYDNSFTCNMNDDKCTRSQCQCDSHMVDEIVKALKNDRLNRNQWVDNGQKIRLRSRHYRSCSNKFNRY